MTREKKVNRASQNGTKSYCDKCVEGGKGGRGEQTEGGGEEEEEDEDRRTRREIMW